MAKRFLSLLFAFVLLLGVSPVSPWEIAWAEELPELSGTTPGEQVTLAEAVPTERVPLMGETEPIIISTPSDTVSIRREFGEQNSEQVDRSVSDAVVSISIIQPESSTIASGEVVTLICIVESDVTVDSVSFYYDCVYENSIQAKYDPSTGLFIGSMLPKFFGQHTVTGSSCHIASDDRNYYVSRQDTATSSTLRISNIDAADFYVDGGNADTEAPSIVFSSIRTDKTNYEIGEVPTFSCEFEDSSEVLSVHCSLHPIGKSDTGFSMDMQKTPGANSFTAPLYNLYCGEWTVSNIEAMDAWGNAINYVNSQDDSSHIGASFAPNVYVEMGSILFTMGEGGNDDTAPAIVDGSIEVVPHVVGTNQPAWIKVDIIDESPILQSFCQWHLVSNDSISYQTALTSNGDSSDQLNGILFLNSTGTWEMDSIFIEDIYGNEQWYLSDTYHSNNHNYPHIDMSSARIEVIDGVTDECGDNLVWSLDGGTLTISGTGEMWNYKWVSTPWYGQRHAIERICVDEGVTSIGSCAFYDMWRLKEISLPDSITEIGDHAFSNCSQLMSIVMPAGVSSINAYSFEGCSGLSSLTLSEGLTSIGSCAFLDCNSLTTLVIPDSVEYISGDALYGCNAILEFSENCKAFIREDDIIFGKNKDTVFRCDTEKVGAVVLPDSVTTIAYKAFFNCKSITSVTIPKGVTEITYDVFANCNSLQSVSLPEGLAYIRENAFAGCSALTSIQIPVGVRSIGSEAFDSCVSLQQVTLPSGLTSIMYGAFQGCEALQSINFPSSLTAIGSGAFLKCRSLTSITIPEAVSSMGSAIFAGCTSLKKAEINASNAYIGDRMFSSCTSLEQVTLCEGLSSIGWWAFYQCSNLKEIRIPSSVNYIASDAFDECPAELSFAEGGNFVAEDGVIFSRDKAVLYRCNQEKAGSYSIPDTVTAIEPQAFQNCASLTSVTIPEGITVIPFGAFSGCTNLQSVDLPQSLRQIGWSAFENCTSLEKILIPGAAANIDSNAFRNCAQLSDVTLSEGLETIGDYCFYDSAVRKIIIPDTVSSVGEFAFWGCRGLKELTLPNNLSEIKKGTYGSTGLRSVVLPASVRSISAYAFSDCFNLDSVSLPEGLQSIDFTAFSRCPYLKELIIPASTTGLAFRQFDNFTTELHIAPGNTQFIERDHAIYTADMRKLLWCSKNADGVFTVPEDVEVIGSYAFANCGKLSSIVLPNSLTTIESDSFYDCPGLDSIAIPQGVTEIPSGAFGWCRNLQLIQLPDSISSIGESSFAQCTSLKLSTLPSGLSEIRSNAFEGCSQLEISAIPNGVNNIASHAFEQSGITAISIPGSVQSIGRYAFADCAQLSSLDLSEGIQSIGDFAFANDWQLTSVAIPASIRSVGEGAFSGCPIRQISLAEGNGAFVRKHNALLSADGKTLIRCEGVNLFGEFTVPDGVTTIAYGAFSNCSDLIHVNLPDSVTAIAYRAFAGCSSLSSIRWPDSLETLNESAFEGCTALEEMRLPSGVTSIAYGLFGGCTGLHTVDIPDSVKEIGSWAFGKCENLENIEIPDSVSRIGSYAFEKCVSLHSITVPASVIEMHHCVFLRCTGLEFASIEATIDSLPYETFSYCTALKSVSLAKCISEITGYAFYRCQRLSDIELPQNLTVIGNSAFCGCVLLGNLSIPMSVTTIGGDAFRECNVAIRFMNGSRFTEENGVIFNAEKTALIGCSQQLSGKYIVPDGITEISSYAFAGQTAVSEIVLPQNLQVMGANAFEGCANITSIAVPNRIRVIPANAFSGCTELVSVSLPPQLVTIDVGAFYRCRKLKGIAFPNTLERIGIESFSGCESITSIKLPEALADIYWYAFEGCTNLSTIAIPRDLLWVGGYAFAGCDSLTTLYYGGSAEDWANFLPRIEDQNDCLLNADIHFQSAALSGILLNQNGVEVQLSSTGDASPSLSATNKDGLCIIEGIADGVYDITISKQGCVPYKTQATVTGGNLSIDTAFELVAPGNLNGAAVGDTVAGTDDMQCLFEYLSLGDISGVLQGHEEYFRQVADVNGDESVNILDYQSLYLTIQDPSPVEPQG